MRKHNQIHTLGTPHKALFHFLRKLKDFKCALWSEKYGISYFFDVFKQTWSPWSTSM